MAAETLLTGLLFFVAAGAGWFAARYSRSRGERRGPTVPPAQFYRGLDHVLRDESDKAVAVLQGMADADPGVVEIHFALATLFRRRGETDRAIRVRQNLLARPRLARRHREQALFDLAEDYLKAGLYDRAESLYRQLADKGVFRARSLLRLSFIYERQRDWDQAVAVREELGGSESGDHELTTAHYYCEKAGQALAANDLATTRSALRQARAWDKDIVRGALLRARLATLRDDRPLALRLYRRVLTDDPRLAAVVLDRLHADLEAGSNALGEVLRDALRRNPALSVELGKAGLATGLVDNEVIAAAAREVLSTESALASLLDAGHGVSELAAILHSLGLARLEFLCQQCGYRARDLHWQCPACFTWDSSRPDIRMSAAAPS